MALSTKLAERATLSLFIKRFTSSEGHIRNSIFLFDFGVCVVHVCMSIVYARVCMCMHLPMHVPAEIRRGHQVPVLLLSTLFLQDLFLTEPGAYVFRLCWLASKSQHLLSPPL